MRETKGIIYLWKSYLFFLRVTRVFVAPSGKNLVCIPAFSDIVIDGEEGTAIKLIVESK